MYFSTEEADRLGRQNINKLAELSVNFQGLHKTTLIHFTNNLKEWFHAGKELFLFSENDFIVEMLDSNLDVLSSDECKTDSEQAFNLIRAENNKIERVFEERILDYIRSRGSKAYTHLDSLTNQAEEGRQRMLYSRMILNLKTTPVLAYDESLGVKRYLDVILRPFSSYGVLACLDHLDVYYNQLMKVEEILTADNDDMFVTKRLNMTLERLIVEFVETANELLETHVKAKNYDLTDSEGKTYNFESQLDISMLNSVLKDNWYSSETFKKLDFTLKEDTRIRIIL